MSTPTPPTIKIGTLAERLAASANVPLEQAIAGVRAHGPQPTRENPSLAALRYLESLEAMPSSEEQQRSNIATVPSMMPSLIPQQLG